MHSADALVLIVDDVEAVVDELLTFLGLHGITAIAANTLGEAISALEGAPNVSIIACDVRLDRESGLDIVSRIAKNDALRSRRFDYVFVTGDPMHIDYLPAAASHIVLTKPVQPHAMISLFKELLANAGAG